MPEHDAIETFFTDVRDTHLSGVGVKETSYYPYLANLLNTMGKKLKPRVRCIIHPHSIGAGLPDGALSVFAGRIETGHADLNAELIFLHFRNALEEIAFASLSGVIGEDVQNPTRSSL